MDLLSVLTQVKEQLREHGRLSYRILQMQFRLDEQQLALLKEELIDIQEVAADKDGKMLVWKGQGINGETEKGRSGKAGQRQPIPDADSQTDGLSDSRLNDSTPRPPVSYTPVHLADRIRAVTVADGERKTITALFADLKGSTALIEGLDPEEARAVIDPALQLMMDAVHHYDGFVAQALGDGIFALFGAPLAHEDHSQRALYAALRMQETMRRYANTLRQQGYPPLLMRVGLNTGEVVLRSIRKDDLRADYVPVGHSTNLAARMEQLATPGSIVVSAYTHRLTDGYFAFKDLGPTQIKGVVDALNIYELQGLGSLRTRLQVAARRGLTRFVGRQREMEQLNQALAQATAGHGQIVGTMGEPGLGKSRLFHEFKLLSLGGCLVLDTYAVSHGKATAYLPVIELLKRYFDIQAQDDERKRREKVTGKVLNLDRSLEDTLPYLFALLGIEEQPSPLAQMDPQIRRRRTFEALKKLFLRESLNQPLVLIFEDLHWVDGETQGFLDVLSESIASAKLLLLTNYRPEYRHEWGQKTYYTQLRLAPFGRGEAEEFLDVLLGIHSSLQPSPHRGEGEPSLPNGERDRVRGMETNSHALKQLILDKTQGTPFFMEEVVQTLVEDGTLSGTPGHYQLTHHAATQQGLTLQIPPTVQGILAARIDRLTPEEKSLLQQLAVIGRQFPMSLLRQVVTQPDAELYPPLAALQRKEFLYEQPALPENDYVFKHALTQDVAYSSVLIERRKVLHEQTGQAIELLYQDKLEEHYTELAHHYQRSGNMEKAVEYLHKAGLQAVHNSAHAEATTHLQEALKLLSTLRNSQDQGRQETTILTALGASLQITQGFAAPKVEELYLRARKLCKQVGDPAQLFSILRGLRLFYSVGGRHDRGRAIGEELVQLAHDLQDPTLWSDANNALGIPLFWIGDWSQAQQHIERGLSGRPLLPNQSSIFLLSGVSCQGYLAWLSWLLGYPAQAVEKVKSILALAEETTHPFTQSNALTFAAMLGQFSREPQDTQRYADQSITISGDYGFTMFLSWGNILKGWSLGEQGFQAEGIAQIRQGLTAWQATGARFSQPYFLALLAEEYGKSHQYEEGLAAISEALTIVTQNNEHMYEAELYRLKGELLLRQAEQSR